MGPSELATFGLSGLSVLIALVAFVIGRRDRRDDENKEDCEDSKEAGKQDGLVMNKLGVIEHGIDSIERRLDKQDERYLNLVQRVTATEESAKQAHKRLDGLEGKEKK